MAQTMKRSSEKAPEPIAVDPAPQTLDDRTGIEELADRRREKEKVPDGFTKRLDDGHTREITVDKKELGKVKGLPFKVLDTTTGAVIQTDCIRIEGESESVTVMDICTPVGVGIRTKAPILVGRCKTNKRAQS